MVDGWHWRQQVILVHALPPLLGRGQPVSHFQNKNWL